MIEHVIKHLAIIPDGNRRWAKSNKLSAFLGHKNGTEAFTLAAKFCLKNKIKYLSLYAFSLENFNRAEDEKNYLFNLLIEFATNKVQEFVENGIKIKFLGDREFFPEKVKSAIKYMEEKTSFLSSLIINILFCYGARKEIVSAVKNIAEKVKNGAIEISKIDEQMFNNFLWTEGIPDPDLIIRTGKESRLSNFLLYQAAYSELMFLDCFWPEITEERLNRCIEDFKSIKRNFGK